MAEYAYLVAAPEPRKRGELRFLLSGKRNHPFAWLLAMAGSACADDDANVLASPTAAAIDRAKKRFARLHPLSGPRLRATFDGFLKYLESVREPFLLLDATDLDGFEEDDLDSAIALDDAAFDPSELDLDPWEAGADEDDDDDAGDWRFELSGGGRDATYLMFGSVEEGDSAWLRPPEKNDTDRASAVLAAMAGYTRMAGPTTVRTGTSFTFSHPVHRGAVFRVVLTDDDEYALSIHPSEDNASDLHDHRALSLGSFPETPRLAAWAAHVAAHFSLLTFPTEDDWIHGRRYWLTPGGLEFGLRMPTYAPDADDLRSRVVDRLCAAISDFVMSDAPWISLDLGPLGSLILEHVNDPGREPHVRARRTLERGDITWRIPRPTYLLSPPVQIAIVDEVLAQHGAALASADGWQLAWRHRGTSTRTAAGESELVLFGDRVEPERFTMGFMPARTQSLEESPATIVFRGAALLILMADGARVSFRFQVPADLGPQTPLFVSGWWVARSGDRFASILRIGTHTLRFDNDGKLIGS